MILAIIQPSAFSVMQMPLNVKQRCYNWMMWVPIDVLMMSLMWENRQC